MGQDICLRCFFTLLMCHWLILQNMILIDYSNRAIQGKNGNASDGRNLQKWKWGHLLAKFATNEITWDTSPIVWLCLAIFSSLWQLRRVQQLNVNLLLLQPAREWKWQKFKIKNCARMKMTKIWDQKSNLWVRIVSASIASCLSVSSVWQKVERV